MDAPLYPPAAAFEQPIAQTEALSLDNYSLAELRNMPAAWEIIAKRLPALNMMVKAPMIQPHLGNFTIYTVQTFVKTITPETITAINEELRRLPPVEPTR